MDGYVTIGTELDTKGFDKEINLLEDKLNDIKATLRMADDDKTLFSTTEIKQMEAEAQKLGRRIDNLREKQAKLDNAGFAKMKNGLENVGKSIQKVTKKVVKWGLAIFSVRSAYMFVRNAINTIAGDDEQLKADIDYMKSALAYTLEPLVRGIVNLAKQLLFYVGYIAKAWTGKNIFENANKSLANANKQAKELKKTTAGFDELNILSEDTSKKTVMPSFDLSAPKDADIPKWVKWIANNGGIVKKIIEGIGIAIASLKLGTLLQTLGLFTSLPLWQLVGGLGLILTGVSLAIKGIIDFLKEPTWQNFLTILEGISLTVAGIAVLLGGWVVALVALGVAIVTYVIKNWDKIREILGKVGSWIYDHVIKPVGDFFSGLWEGVKNSFIGVWNFIKDAFSKGGQIFNGLKEGIVNVFITVVNSIISGINKIIRVPFDLINGLLNKIRNTSILGFKPFEGLWRENPLPVPQIPTIKLAKGAIANRPGRGIPTTGGGARWAEAGQEAYLPLTDEQVMSTLGKKIGENVTIQAVIPVYAYNRQVDKQIRIIKAEDDFAFNR